MKATHWHVAVLFLFTSQAIAQQTPPAEVPLGDISSNPGNTCWDIKQTRKDQIASRLYWIRPDPNKPAFRVWCLMSQIEYGEIGGWTLVANNYVGGGSKPFANLDWEHATQSLPIYANLTPARSDDYVDDPDSFLVFVGLEMWSRIATQEPRPGNPGSKARGEILYLWSMSPGRAKNPDHAVGCKFRFDRNDNYKLIIMSGPQGASTNNLDCAILAGNSMPDMFLKHNDKKFSTFDRDNDSRSAGNSNCAALTGAPFWHVNCWNGSIFGSPNSAIQNGAYWTGSDAKPGTPDGKGRGVGLLFVR